MSTTPNRRPKGQSEGGQFAPSKNPESGLTLLEIPKHECVNPNCAKCHPTMPTDLVNDTEIERQIQIREGDFEIPEFDSNDEEIEWFRAQYATKTALINDIIALARTPNLSGADVVQMLDDTLTNAGFSVDWADDDPAESALDQGPSPEDAWIAKYKPMRNRLNEDAPYEGTMYETFGAELEYARHAVRRDHVWTLIEGDDGSFISPGYHLVNRMGYFITEEPWDNQTGDVDLRDGPEYCRDCDGTNSVPCTEDGTELLDGDFDDADYRRCTDCGAVRPN
jgi:hypothetical protein